MDYVFQDNSSNNIKYLGATYFQDHALIYIINYYCSSILYF